jgi:hypothetical protein
MNHVEWCNFEIDGNSQGRGAMRKDNFSFK